jgi:hypothetical protein
LPMLNRRWGAQLVAGSGAAASKAGRAQTPRVRSEPAEPGQQASRGDSRVRAGCGEAWPTVKRVLAEGDPG